MKPFLLGRKDTEAKPLCATVPTSAAQPLRGAKAAGPAQPGAHVEVIKQGDKVIRIVVTCACGERTEIECLYPANS